MIFKYCYWVWWGLMVFEKMRADHIVRENSHLKSLNDEFDPWTAWAYRPHTISLLLFGACLLMWVPLFLKLLRVYDTRLFVQDVLLLLFSYRIHDYCFRFDGLLNSCMKILLMKYIFLYVIYSGISGFNVWIWTPDYFFVNRPLDAYYWTMGISESA